MSVAPDPRWAVVTGAASGLGEALCARLATGGWHILAVDRTAPRPGIGRFLCADLLEADDIDTVIEEFRALPPLALVNCAGMPDTAGIDEVLRVNFLAARRLADAARAVAADVRLVHVASGVARQWATDATLLMSLAGEPDEAALLIGARALIDIHRPPYTLSKQLLCAHARLHAGRIAGGPGRINCVLPGPIATPMLAGFRATMGDAMVDAAEAAVGKFATADEIAATIQFLVGDDAQWVNGAELLVDGGLSAKFAAPSA